MYVNPPFGVLSGKSLQGQFLQKAVEGRAEEVLLLLKAAVGYLWFNTAMKYPHAFLADRVAFETGDHNVRSSSLANEVSPNPHGSIVVYLGRNIEKFCSSFADVGHIPGLSSWACSP